MDNLISPELAVKMEATPPIPQMEDTALLDTLINNNWDGTNLLYNPCEIMFSTLQQQLLDHETKITQLLENVQKHENDLDEFRKQSKPPSRKKQKREKSVEKSVVTEPTDWFISYNLFVHYLRQNKCVPPTTSPLYIWYNAACQDKLGGKLDTHQTCAFLYACGMIDGIQLTTTVVSKFDAVAKPYLVPTIVAGAG